MCLAMLVSSSVQRKAKGRRLASTNFPKSQNRTKLGPFIPKDTRGKLRPECTKLVTHCQQNVKQAKTDERMQNIRRYLGFAKDPSFISAICNGMSPKSLKSVGI